MCQSLGVPLFIVYSYLSVIILSLIISFSVLLKNPKHPLNRNAFYFIFILGLWTAVDLARWTVRDVQENYLFFRLSYLINLFFLFFLFFSYKVVGEKLSRRKKTVLALPALATVFAMAGNFGIGQVDAVTCAYQLGWLIFPSIFICLTYSVWASVILLKKYHHPLVHYKTKLQIRTLIFTIMVTILWGIAYQVVDIFNAARAWNIEISPYLILGNLFFLAMIVFNIIEYDLFDFDIPPRKWFAFSIISVIFFGMFFLALTPMVYAILLIFYLVVIWVFWGKGNVQ